MKKQNYSLINQNLHKSIYELSFPGMISSVLQTLYQLIDAYWVGKLGASALAAIGGSSFIMWAIFSLSALSVNGITTLVAQSVGAGDEEKGRYAAGQGMLINTISAVVIAIVVFVTQNMLFRVMGFDEIVFNEARTYLSIVLSGLIFSFWFVGMEGVFRGIGDTKTPMIILAIALLLNAVLDPVFIFGWFGFPEMGVAGAAFATILSEIVAAGLCVYILRKKKFLPDFRVRIDKIIIWRILSIGSPIAFGGFFFSLIYVALTGIIARFGTEAIAAIGVCHRIEGIAWFACVGYSAAASTLVGQNVGARSIASAQKAAWWVNIYGVMTLFLVSVVFFFWPEWLMSVFTTDVSVQKIGVEYLRIIAVFEIFLGLEVIMEGAFSGAGYTLPVMLVSVPVTLSRIPLAWFFAINLDWGTKGIWWAIALTTFLKGLLNTILFAMGLWKKKIGEIK
ncbi:MAG: MATE family efflux transporter [Calditrichaceae bacterium]